MRFLIWDDETEHFILSERTISKRSPYKMVENILSTSPELDENMIKILKEEEG